MNLMNILMENYSTQANNPTWGDYFGLWDISESKRHSIPTLIIYYKKAQNKSLSKYLHEMTNTIILKQIDAIRTYFSDKDMSTPEEPHLEDMLEGSSKFMIPNKIISDEDIANGLGMNLRYVISLETEALKNAVSTDARKLVFDILQEDNNEYEKVLNLLKKENWISFPPNILHH